MIHFTLFSLGTSGDILPPTESPHDVGSPHRMRVNIGNGTFIVPRFGNASARMARNRELERKRKEVKFEISQPTKRKGSAGNQNPRGVKERLSRRLTSHSPTNPQGIHIS